jgi:hypothetical protein
VAGNVLEKKENIPKVDPKVHMYVHIFQLIFNSEQLQTLQKCFINVLDKKKFTGGEI